MCSYTATQIEREGFKNPRYGGIGGFDSQSLHPSSHEKYCFMSKNEGSVEGAEKAQRMGDNDRFAEQIEERWKVQ